MDFGSERDMKYNTASTFPFQIDDRILFSDIRLENESALGEYKNLISQKKYDEAVAYLKSHSEVDAYCADLFNMLVERTRAVQEYCKDDYVPPSGGGMPFVNNIPSNASSLEVNTICISDDVI